jgi:hypothetical protein
VAIGAKANRVMFTESEGPKFFDLEAWEPLPEPNP